MFKHRNDVPNSVNIIKGKSSHQKIIKCCRLAEILYFSRDNISFYREVKVSHFIVVKNVPDLGPGLNSPEYNYPGQKLKLSIKRAGKMFNRSSIIQVFSSLRIQCMCMWLN